MAIYDQEDIQVSLDGELCLDSKGDLAMADSLETRRAAVNFLLRTDRKDYQPNPFVGANLGSYIGKTNTPDVHEEMEYSCNYALQRILATQDFVVTVVPFDLHEALCVVNVAGIYKVDNKYQQFDKERIVYAFPFIEGNPTPLIS